MPNAPVPALAAALLVVTSGCVNTDPAVFVEASIASPSATVTAGALGANVVASFQLVLHLGARASGPSAVSVQTFEITSADRRSSIVSPLAVTTTAKLPVEVAPDSDVTVDFTYDSGARPRMQDDVMPLCATDGIRIQGTIEDSLEGGATPVASDVFHAGCM
jgi:hypothetical protein